jgi:hypothetical protein
MKARLALTPVKNIKTLPAGLTCFPNELLFYYRTLFQGSAGGWDEIWYCHDHYKTHKRNSIQNSKILITEKPTLNS